MGCVMTQLDEVTTLLKEDSAEAAGVRASSEFIVQYTYFSRISLAPCLPQLPRTPEQAVPYRQKRAMEELKKYDEDGPVLSLKICVLL